MFKLHGTSMILLFDEQMQGKSRILRAASVTIGSKIGPSNFNSFDCCLFIKRKTSYLQTPFVVLRGRYFGMADTIRRYRKKFLGGSILSKGVKESAD